MRSLCALVLALVACVPVIAQTPFPVRFVEAGQTVTVPKGDYILSRDVIVRKFGTLILEAGVRVQVKGLGNPVQVYGTLDVRGTEAEPVVIGPDAGNFCGTIAAYYVDGPRPKVLIDYLRLTTTRNSNSLLLSAADFSVSNSVIDNQSTSTSRVCILAGNNAVRVISDCYLKCLTDSTSSTAGVSIGNGAPTRQADAVQLVNVITEDCKDPVRIQKRIALLNGTIE